jgi:hypothetical protein
MWDQIPTTSSPSIFPSGGQRFQKWRIRLQNLINNFTNKMKKAYESNKKIVTLMEKA